MDERGSGQGGPNKVGVYDRTRVKSTGRKLLWLVVALAVIVALLFWLRDANAAEPIAEPVAASGSLPAAGLPVGSGLLR